MFRRRSGKINPAGVGLKESGWRREINQTATARTHDGGEPVGDRRITL